MRTSLLILLPLFIASCSRQPGAADAVEVRVHNLSTTDFDSVIVQFPRETHRYGAVTAGAQTRYEAVAQAYRYARVEVWTDGERHVLQPIDFTGESLLPPGRYTYGLTFGGSPPQLGLVMADAYRQNSGVLFLTAARPQTEVMQALFEGRVVLDPAGCIRLHSPDDATVVWPHGFTLSRQEGGLHVLDAGGRDLGSIGGAFRFGGGEVTGLTRASLDEADADAAMLRCPGRYWIVGETQ